MGALGPFGRCSKKYIGLSCFFAGECMEDHGGFAWLAPFERNLLKPPRLLAEFFWPFGSP